MTKRHKPSVFSIREISDRQDLIDYTKTRRAGYDSFMSDRTDMYRIQYNGPEGRGDHSWFVEYNPDSKELYLHSQGGSSSSILTSKAKLFFEHSPQYKEMLRNWTNLTEGGYLDYHRAISTGVAEKCPTCSRAMAKGATHKHTLNSSGVFPYHSRQEDQRLETEGFKRMGRSGIDETKTPPLEDMGLTERQIQILGRDKAKREAFMNVKNYNK